MDDSVPAAGLAQGAVGNGALAVGNVKYLTQQALLQHMLEADAAAHRRFEHAFATAREKA